MTLAKFLISVALMGAMCLSFASEPTPVKPIDRSGRRIVLVNKTNNTISKRPRVPSRQVIECTYNGDCLAFTFAVSEGECEVTLTDNVTLSAQTHFIDSDCCHAEIYVGELSETTVTLVTESGTTYSGTLTSE